MYGDERFASRIAREVVTTRQKVPIETTFQLVDVIKRAIPAAARRHGGHPARKTFQALRIEVNHELDALDSGLRAAVRWANPGGRICVISYHSLEDKLVKAAFAAGTESTAPPGLPIVPEEHQPGVDLILPDFEPLKERLDDIVGIVLTHGGQ